MKKSGFVQYKHIKVTDTPAPVGYSETGVGLDFNNGPEEDDYPMEMQSDDDESDEADNIDYNSCPSESPSDAEDEKRPRIRSADRKKKFPDELTEETDFKILSPPTIK